MSASMPTKIVSLSFFPSQRTSANPTDIQPGPSVERSSVEVLEESPATGLVRVGLPTTEVLPTPVSSSSSSEKLDYSGDDDDDWMMCTLLLIPANILIWPKRRCR